MHPHASLMWPCLPKICVVNDVQEMELHLHGHGTSALQVDRKTIREGLRVSRRRMRLISVNSWAKNNTEVLEWVIKRLRSSNLHHSRQCGIVLKPCSDHITTTSFGLRRMTAAKSSKSSTSIGIINSGLVNKERKWLRGQAQDRILVPNRKHVE